MTRRRGLAERLVRAEARYRLKARRLRDRGKHESADRWLEVAEAVRTRRHRSMI